MTHDSMRQADIERRLANMASGVRGRARCRIHGCRLHPERLVATLPKGEAQARLARLIAIESFMSNANLYYARNPDASAN
jgi:hypothetical protein